MIWKHINWALIAAAFIAGTSAGASASWWLVSFGEEARLEKALELRKQENIATQKSLKEFYENRPAPPPKIRTVIKKVVKYVTTDPVCDVTPAEQCMLDRARTGVQSSAGRCDEGARGLGEAEAADRVPERITRAAEVAAHVDAANRYKECYAAAKAVLVYFGARQTPTEDR